MTRVVVLALTFACAGTAFADRAIIDVILSEPLPSPESQHAVAGTLSSTHNEPFRLSDALAYGLKLPITIHQEIVSPHDGDNCTFTPSCSEYGNAALKRYGLIGWAIASDRLLRCHTLNVAAYQVQNGLKLDRLLLEDKLGASVIGGAMSAVLPGLGQAAAGDVADGLYSLVTVAALAFGSAYYALREKPVAAAVSGGFAAFFYVGNVYGGARALGRPHGG